MRSIAVIFALVFMFAPALSYSADDVGSKIDKACLRHAVSLVARLKAEVLGDLSQSQSDRALKMATESCEAYFRREFGQGKYVSADKDKDATESGKGSDKSFLDKLLDESPEEKKGNDRIKRKQGM